MVGRTVLKGWGLLACISLGLALIWKQVSFPPMAPHQFGIHFYQHVVGELDGRSCGSYPVCSSYAKEAFAEHGWLIGSWLMLDRLIHEAGDAEQGPYIMVEGQRRLYDPLSRNDAWLR